MSEHNSIAIKQYKPIALLLAFLSMLSILAMLHHPSISATDIQEQINEFNEEAQLNAMVHGILIAFTILISICLTFYAQMRGFNRASILPGTIFYWLGSLSMITAALMSGFVGPWLAEIYILVSKEQLEIFKGLSTLQWLINQAFANFGAFCWCIAMAAWSFDMLSRHNIIRVFGALSFLVAVTLIAALTTGFISLNVSGMTIVLIAVCTWQSGIAWLLYRRQ